jgi:transposase
MARKDRLSMQMQQQIFELHKRGYSIRRIARCLKKSRKTVVKYLSRNAEVIPIKPPETSITTVHTGVDSWRSAVDWPHVIEQRRKGVSYKTLFKENAPDGVSYWLFWNTLRSLVPAEVRTTVHLVHKPGEKTQVDYKDGVEIFDRETGKSKKCYLFVGVMAFSKLTFAEATMSQKQESFIASHERMWDYFGGVTEYVVPDNLKSAVVKAHLYDPDINPTFCAYANHANFAVLPARPCSPRDKAAVESGIGILQRTFLEQVRNRKFYSLHEVNEALREFLEEFNNSIMKDYGASRRERFETEKDLLQNLPNTRFEITEWTSAKVHPDCHIQIQRCLYSAPWTYVGKTVRVRLRSGIVEIFDAESAEAIASHPRAPENTRGHRETNPLHWPPEKREFLSFDIARAKQNASRVGPRTLELVDHLFSLKHPLQYLRRVQGMLRLVESKEFASKDLEYAATAAMSHRSFRLGYIKSCCEFHANGGAQLRAIANPAPLRTPETLHLQRNRNEK